MNCFSPHEILISARRGCPACFLPQMCIDLKNSVALLEARISEAQVLLIEAFIKEKGYRDELPKNIHKRIKVTIIKPSKVAPVMALLGGK